MKDKIKNSFGGGEPNKLCGKPTEGT